MNKDYEFLGTFNEFYPFERYIVRDPQPINYLFDDIVLTEIFVPSTEMDESYVGTGEFYLNEDDIYIKVRTKGGEEVRVAYFDFSEGVRETILGIIWEDFGEWEWECLYCEQEDYTELKDLLDKEKALIEKKYGECKVKDNFNKEDIIEWMKENKNLLITG